MSVFKDLKGKRVVITGAASGIGLAAAQRFIDEGSSVFIVDNNPNALKKSLKENPKLAGGIQADVGIAEDVEKIFLKVDETMEGLDVLVSNAGISVRKPFLEIDYQQWQRVISVNLNGMFLCCQQAIRRMKEQMSGVVLLTASTNGIEGHPLYSDYNASKAGVISLAKTLALEFAPWLRVNAICPGYVMTPMQQAEYTPEMLAEVNDMIPLNRHASTNEVASFFAFLASSESSYITGQAIPIDGGETSGQFLKNLI